MKRLLCIIACLYPLFCIAQIDIQIDFNQEKKIVNLTLTNKTDKLFILAPAAGTNTDLYSTIQFTYKDKQDSIISKGIRCISDWQWIKKNGRWETTSVGRILHSFEKNKFIHKATEICNNRNIYQLEVSVLLKANAIKEKRTYEIKYAKKFLWK